MRASSLNGNSSCLFLGSIVRSCDSLALGSVWSPLKARNPTKTTGLLSCKSMSTNSPVVRVKEKIDLTEKEKMIFDRLLATVGHFDLSTRLRVAGGWVRDKRRNGDPLRVYMDLEAGRRRSGREDIFISYHAKDDVQSTYAGSLFHNGRNYHVSSYKDHETLVYWSSSRCLPQRNGLAKNLLKLLPHHSFGKCLNNVGGLDKTLSFYLECANDVSVTPKWWDHLHCAMSHYKFVLAIENTWTESYVTEKLFYALDAGAVPIYFGAPNVMDFVPPHSIIDGNKFSSMEELATFVKSLANDLVPYAEYHAWRRCGVLGNYGNTRAASLNTLPCRLCEFISKKRWQERESFMKSRFFFNTRFFSLIIPMMCGVL